MRELIANTAAWAGADGGGFVGEFTGAAAGVTTNENGLEPLGLFAGAAGPLSGDPAVYGTIAATASGAAHPILAGVALPRDPLALHQ